MYTAFLAAAFAMLVRGTFCLPPLRAGTKTTAMLLLLRSPMTHTAFHLDVQQCLTYIYIYIYPRTLHRPWDARGETILILGITSSRHFIVHFASGKAPSNILVWWSRRGILQVRHLCITWLLCLFASLAWRWRNSLAAQTTGPSIQKVVRCFWNGGAMR